MAGAAGAARRLVGLLGSGSEEVREAAARGLWCLDIECLKVSACPTIWDTREYDDEVAKQTSPSLEVK